MTPEIVIRKLTDGQKRAILWLPADGSERTEDKTPHIKTSLWTLTTKAIGQDVYAVLAARRTEMKMVNGRWLPSHWRATKLGLAVRAKLAGANDAR